MVNRVGNDNSSIEPGEYEVQWGDTLSGIAARSGIGMSVLAELAANQQTIDSGNLDLIFAGSKIMIPDSDSSAGSSQSQAPISSSSVPNVESNSVTSGGGHWPVPGYTEINVADKTGEGHGHFGASRSGGSRTHKGLDINAPVGTPVVSYQNGVVSKVDNIDDSSAGKAVTVDHANGVQTKYFHLGSTEVTVGQQVTAGQKIAEIGRTGNTPTAGDTHLHFEIRENGVALDPEEFISPNAASTASSAVESEAFVPSSTGAIPATGDSHSDNRIALLHPEIQQRSAAFVNEVKQELGIQLRVTDGLRTFAEQNDLFENGGEGGQVVTKARGGQSYHNYGLAIDVVELNPDGSVDYNTNYEAIAAIGEKYGFEWGGNFTSITDKPHFQYTAGFSTSELLARSNNGQNPYVDLN